MSVWTLAPGAPGYPAQLADLAAIERGELAARDAGGGPTLSGLGRIDAIAGLEPGAAVTIIGSRRATGYGLRVAERLARDLALAGVTVVSGMAIGIDAAAHRGALAGDGPTVAVLAGGPNVVYPRRHRGLHARIAAAGAVISDRPAGRAPRKADFPARNRIMAALSRVVVVVEAAQPSGSLITAERARELGREVAAVPNQVGPRVAAGANALIKDGAHLVRDATDVLDLLAGVGVARIVPAGARLAPGLERVLEAVEAGARTPDELTRAAGIDAGLAAAAIARLELLGYLETDALGALARTPLERPN